MSKRTSVELENIILTFANRVLDVRNSKENPTLGEMLDVPVQAIFEWHEKQKKLEAENDC